ncbi:Hypothetical protein HDN1F_11240 [gamma proteobacterium HdN1]|nr:Hypothetical protein HDN1F_11240 [gamma proteobacterium HdN1]
MRRKTRTIFAQTHQTHKKTLACPCKLSALAKSAPLVKPRTAAPTLRLKGSDRGLTLWSDRLRERQKLHGATMQEADKAPATRQRRLANEVRSLALSVRSRNGQGGEKRHGREIHTPRPQGKGNP